MDPSSNVQELTARVQSLAGEVTGLRRAMRTRGVIEQAKGMLAVRLECTPEQAFGHLSQLSQEQNVRLAELAEHVVRQALSEPEPEPRPTPGADHLDGYRRLEQVGGLGWAAWDLGGAPVAWSAGMYRLLHRDPARGPVALDRLRALRRWLPPEDVPGLERALRLPVESGEPAGADLRLRRGGRERLLRLRTEPVRDALGTVVGLFTLGQDVTAQHRADPDRQRRERQLAAYRMRQASDRRRQDHGGGVGPPELTVTLPGLRILARHVTPTDTRCVSGDFYQAVPLPDGAVLLAVGDGFGTGAEYLTTMNRLSAELRGLALAGADPARLLTLSTPT
jgi:PAS domain-containing protein